MWLSPFIVACGRLVPTTGFADLIDAFARVRRVRPLTLIILGEGPERPSLERRALEQGVGGDVVMPGYVVNPFPYVRRAAAFCLSSRFEAFPASSSKRWPARIRSRRADEVGRPDRHAHLERDLTE